MNSNHKAIQCDICDHWIHIKCNGLKSSDYLSMQNSSDSWFCSNCIADNLPFGQTASPLSFNNSLSSVEIREFLHELNSLDLDEMVVVEGVGGVNCKYYDVNEFSDLDTSLNYFSLFHLNIASLTKHYDELRVLLDQLGHGFSIAGHH